MLPKRIKFILLFLQVCAGGKNSSGSSAKEATCDGDKVQCNGESAKKESSAEEWKPFQYEATTIWVTFDSLFSTYNEWHKATLFNSAIPCHRKKALIFTPNAGLGDSIGALTAAFHHSIKTGRLFFIDWKPYNWTCGLRSLGFISDYSAAKSLRDPETRKPLLCVKKAKDPASFMQGHVTNEHAILSEPVLNDYHFGGDKLAQRLLQPAKKVSEIVRSIMNSKEQNPNSLMVSLVIRTGEGEYNQFLSKGDEKNFVQCFRNYAKSKSRNNKKLKFRVFVTSDYVKVKNKVVEELKTGDNGGLSVDVLTLSDSIVHVMQVKENTKDKSILDRIHKTYAEFFLIGQSDVLFLTHGSLFGRAAAERGSVTESNVYYISDSNCDGVREKHSYLNCHKPKYPSVCGLT